MRRLTSRLGWANNLDLLGDELGIKLELVEREKAVGPMSLDILARETETGELVAIENQLEWTDTHHLGQLLTYATGCDAHVAIWVATEFRHEYAKALHRLNEWTGEGNRFYGVKIELVRQTGSLQDEPRFRKVVYPGGWDIDNTLRPDPPPRPIAQEAPRFLPASDRGVGSDGALQTTPSCIMATPAGASTHVSTEPWDMRYPLRVETLPG